MTKIAYDLTAKATTSPKENRDIIGELSEALYTAVGRRFEVTWWNDGTVEYDDDKLTSFEKTQVENFLANLKYPYETN